MFRNYVKLAWRNLTKRKAYSFINILGLALGTSICLMIFVYIHEERSVDAWRPDTDHVYRMVLERSYPNRVSNYAVIPQSFAKTLKDNLDQVDDAVRIFNFLSGGTYQVRYADKKFEEANVFMVDPSFFNVFTSEFLYGNSTNPLESPNSIVITESSAIKYFGNPSIAVGKLIQPEGSAQEPLKISAVVKDWPDASHFKFNMLLTTAGKPNFDIENFVNFSAYTYLKLNPNANPKDVERVFPSIIERFAAGDIEKQFAMSFDDFQKSGNSYTYTLQALKEIYLTSNLEAEFKTNGNLKTLYIFGIIAVFIIIIAAINFINLSTARASERAREVGVRKAFGSEKSALVFQFLTESIISSLLAIIIAVGLFYLLIPLFNDISGREFTFSMLLSLKSISLLVVLAIVLGVLSGLYPAFVLSSFKPISVLQGKFKNTNSGKTLRSSLVVFQFVITVILIICTLIVNRQLDFMTSGNLGFNKEQTIIVNRSDLLGNNINAFKTEVEKLPAVNSLSGTSAMPGQTRYFGVSWATPETQSQPITGRGVIVDNDYATTLGLELVKGRFFSKEFASDSLAVVLNEQAVKELQLEDPIGKKVLSPDGWLNGKNGESYTYEIVGVVKDFHFQSLHELITPLVFNSSTRFNGSSPIIAISLDSVEAEKNLVEIDKIWSSFVKDKAFQYEFLDSLIDSQYVSETTTKKLFTFFSGVAIFIACLGLLGLAAYTTRQRVQEIGIRKVLGASVPDIIGLMSVDFMRLVILSALIAVPIAWYVMHTWLQNFPYRIESSWGIFALSCLLAVTIAFVTIIFQAISAATANPIKALRTE